VVSNVVLFEYDRGAKVRDLSYLSMSGGQDSIYVRSSYGLVLIACDRQDLCQKCVYVLEMMDI
jgi:hypothetical protein